jgi:hypothetical protein
MKVCNYKVVLYNNGNNIKTVAEFEYYTDALNKFNQLIQNNQIYFPKKYMWNYKIADYELAILNYTDGKKIDTLYDEKGLAIKINTTGNFGIKKIQKYYVEEQFKLKNNGKRYKFEALFDDFIDNTLTKSICFINNKLIIEFYENTNILMFITKNILDAERLHETIRKHCVECGITNVLFFGFPSYENKKELYERIMNKFDINKTYLFRNSTR